MAILSAMVEASRATTCLAPAWAERKLRIPDPAAHPARIISHLNERLTGAEIQHYFVLESDRRIAQNSLSVCSRSRNVSNHICPVCQTIPLDSL